MPRTLFEEDPREWPHIIRSLVSQWSVDGSEAHLEIAGEIAAAILSREAGLESPWALFPLFPGSMAVSIPYAADAMEALLHLWAARGEGPLLGKAQHVAHVLVSQQSPAGWWRQTCDALNGSPCDNGRCAAAPLRLMSALDRLLDRCEFASAIEGGQRWLLSID